MSSLEGQAQPGSKYTTSLKSDTARLDSPESTKRASSPTSQESNALRRANTLSWQQRPSRNGLTGPRSRPQSGLIDQNPFVPQSGKPAASDTENLGDASRNDIAKSLAQKDPSWFKQTHDRGLGSAAYRKNQESDQPGTSSTDARRVLPGLGQVPTDEATKPNTPPTTEIYQKTAIPTTTAQMSSDEDSPTEAKPSSTTTLPSGHPLSHLVKLEPTEDRGDSLGGGNVLTTMQDPPGTLRRASPERGQRSQSPTKGLGGFVQSAMMKRSDSVSKRWSAQATPGLSRSDSVASVQGGYGLSRAIPSHSPAPDSRPNSVSRENTPVHTSRPTSKHASQLQGGEYHIGETSRNTATPQEARPKPTTAASPKTNGYGRPLDPNPIEVPQPELKSPPSSPSKRWSPTKSSWLENAINKPESPKPKFGVPQQPSWMADLGKARSQKPEADIAKPAVSHEVKTAGFLRSPPLGSGSKPLALSKPTLPSIPKGNLDEMTTKTSEQSARRPLSGLRNDETTSNNTTTGTPRKQREATMQEDSHNSTARSQSKSDSPAPSVSPKPTEFFKSSSSTPPRLGSVASIRSTSSRSQGPSQEEAEFKSVFGKLRRTETKNYVAPDELKNNILRGKAGLNLTGGPKKTERADEFKESILKKKQQMKEMKDSQTAQSVEKTSLSDQPEALPLRSSADKVHHPNLQSTSRKEASEQVEAALGQERSAAEVRSPPSVAKKSPQANSFASRSVIRKVGTGDEPSTSSTAEVERKSRELSATSANAPESVSTSTSPNDRTKPSNSFANSLAGMLARRPSPSTPKAENPTKTHMVRGNVPREAAPQESSRQLEHMTKSRAKGPKRRAPTGKAETSSKPIGFAPSESDQSTGQSSLHISTGLSAAPEVSSHPNDLKQSSERVTSAEAVKPKPDGRTSSGMPNSTSKPSERAEHTKEDYSAKTSQTVPLRSPNLPNPRSPFAQSSPSKPATTRTTKPTSPPPPTKPLNLSISPSSPNNSKPPSISHKPSQPVTAPDTPIDTANAKVSVKTLLASHLSSTSASAPQRTVIDTASVISKLSSSNKIKTLRKSISELGPHGSLHALPQSLEHILFSAHIYLLNHLFTTAEGVRTTEVYLWHGLDVPPSQIDDSQLFARRAAKDAGGKLLVIKQNREPTEFIQALGGILITRRGFSSLSSSPTKASATYMLRGRRYLSQIAFDEVDLAANELCSGFPHLVSAPFGRLYLWKGQGAGADELGCARLIGMDLGLTGEIEEVDEGKESDDFWQSFPRDSRKRAITADVMEWWKRKATCESYTTRLFSIDVEHPRPKSSSSGGVASFGRWVRQGSIPNISTAPESNDPRATIKEISPFSQDDLSPGGVYLLDAFFELYV